LRVLERGEITEPMPRIYTLYFRKRENPIKLFLKDRLPFYLAKNPQGFKE